MSGARPEPPRAASIDVRAGRDALPCVAEWVRSQGSALSLAPALLDRIDVCAAELVANVLEHGLDGDAGSTVRVALRVDAGSVRLVIDDEARPFDPLRRASGAPVRMDDTRVGGWGLAIVRHFAHHLDYARTATGNRLTATFLRDPAPAPEPPS